VIFLLGCQKYTQTMVYADLTFPPVWLMTN